MNSVDYDPDRLVYRFTGLTPDSLYVLGVEYFEDTSARLREQSLHINGVEVHGASLLPNFPAKMVYLVPRRAYQDGSITVSFVREQGPNAVVAQLWLYQAHFPGGGPQSAGVVDLKGAVAQLSPARPNPTTGAVNFEYTLASPSRVVFAVYDISGRLVRKLADYEQSVGRHELCWDGKNIAGKRVPAGTYFYQLQVGSSFQTRKVLVVR